LNQFRDDTHTNHDLEKASPTLPGYLNSEGRITINDRGPCKGMNGTSESRHRNHMRMASAVRSWTGRGTMSVLATCATPIWVPLSPSFSKSLVPFETTDPGTSEPVTPNK
jgi:hypothetical protein